MAKSKMLESGQLVAGFVPVDLQTGANSGDWVDFSNYRRCLVIFYAAIGTAGDDATVTINQATSNAGAGSKALAFESIYEKEGSTALSAIAQFTVQSQSASETYVSTTGGENEQLVCIEIADTDLDLDGDFSHVQISVADIGTNPQLGCALYLLFEPRYGAKASSMPSAI